MTCGCCARASTVGTSRRAFIASSALATASVATTPAHAFLDDLAAALTSPEQTQQLGERAFDQIRNKERVSGNRSYQRRLETIGERVVRASDVEIPASQWDFVVFEGDQVNAFALPGGNVGFYEGIFRVFQNDAQLAAVVGHEVAHVQANHVAERIGTSKLTQLGSSIISQFVLGDSGFSDELAGLLGLGAEYGIARPFGRSQELEADRLGLRYMARAGYDPEAALAFWQRMQQAKGSGGPPAFLSTHPSSQARIQEIRETLPEVRPLYRRQG